jgi:hypothetical protein
MTDHHDPTHDPSLEQDRIDALARSAGVELRRPAPADGIARVHRAKRTRQLTQVGAGGLAAIVLVGAGVVTFRSGDTDRRVVPATVSVPDASLPDSTVPDTSAPTSSTPGTPAPATTPPNATGGPSVIYTSGEGFSSFGSEVSTVDVATGAVTGTVTVDQALSDASRAAQDALGGEQALAPARVTTGQNGVTAQGQPDAGWFTYEFDVAGTTLGFDVMPSDAPHLDMFSSDTLARFDRCGQSELRVSGASDTALPGHVFGIVVSADARWIVTRSADCSADGTLADGYVDPSAIRYALFDAAHLEEPGRVLVDDGPAVGVGAVSFSADGEFVVVEDGMWFFSTSTGDRLEVADDGCAVQGTKWSRFIGPWVSGSSVALQVTCESDAALVVRDLATGEVMEVPVSMPGDTSTFTADVDYAHYDRPSNVWYTVCVATVADDGTSTTTCELGVGSEPRMALPGAAEASFVQLGFVYGG